MNRKRLAVMVVTVLAFMLLASPAMAGKYNVEEKRIDEVEPEDGRALVYVVRSSRAGAMIYFWTFIDDQFLGVTRGPGYTYAQVEPGEHMIWSKAENVAALDVELEAGKTYFIKQVVLPGFGKARTRVELLTEEEGRKALKKAKKLSMPTEEAGPKAAEIVEKHLDRAREKAARDEEG